MALYALQHRGQERAGIAVNDGGVITFHKDVGLVPDVFDQATMKALGTGQIAVGTRSLFRRKQAGARERPAACHALRQGNAGHRPQRSAGQCRRSPQGA